MSVRQRFGATATVAALSIAAVAILFPSCATSSGSAYSSASSAESAAARRGRDEEHAPRPNKPDKGGNVFVWIQDEAEYEPTGNLILRGLVQGSSVSIDGSYRSGWKLRLSVGRHELKVERYGYEDFAATFDVYENRDTVIDLRQFPASFRILGLRLLPGAFDPGDPGHLGACAIVIETSAPGSGRLSVLDESGREVRSLENLAFNEKYTRATWDGTGDSGAVLPPGAYAIIVEGRGEGGGAEDRYEAAANIVAGTRDRIGLLHDGVSGSLLAPDARCLASGRLETGVGGIFHLSPIGAFMAGLCVVEIGLRAGLPAASGLELGASGMMVLWPGDPVANSASVSLSLKGALTESADSKAAAWYLKASYAGFVSEYAGEALPSWDGATRYAGLSAGLILELAFLRARAFVAPELQVSGYYPNWARAASPFDPPGLFAWGYLRAGIEASVGRTITLGVSSALRTRPFSSGLGIDLPLPLAVEARWHSRSVPMTITFAASGEVESPESYYFGGGVFASFRL